MINKFLKKIVFCAVLLSVQVICFATPETYSNRVSSGSFSSGFTMEIMDGRYFEVGSGLFLDKSSQFLLKLGIDEREDYEYISAFSFSVDVTVRGYNEENEPLSSEVVTLTVDYSPFGAIATTTDLNYFQKTGGYRYEIEVEPILAPQNVYLEGELTIDRFYPIDVETVPSSASLGSNYVYYDPTTNAESVVYGVNNADIPATGQELEIYWDYIQGAESYELEWTWVDDYSETAGSPLLASEINFSTRDFELNNTRVITADQRYRIPLIFGKGYLIYRVRGIGVWTNDDLAYTGSNKYSKWTTDGSTQTTVADYPHKVHLTTVHEPLKNWQYQAVYAEEGKKKEIVSYFDGSLRNRQTVTRINSNKEAVVGENIYDNQGRSAIQILPTPVENTALKYYPGLNKNGEEAPYSHNDFDWDSGECATIAGVMSTISGASHYYTSDPTDRIDAENNHQDYVPDAKGFPFVQVQYTPDNTGRIRSQSGVGAQYTLNGEHATKYYYLQPYQEELNRLFGYHVGYKSRYKKNLVIDANGQVSVSYLDPQGRVIATALAGDNTTVDGLSPSLLSLDSESDTSIHLLQRVDLLAKDGVDDPDTEIDDNQLFSTPTFSPAYDALHFNSQIGVTDNETTYDFEYRVRTGVFQDECDLDGDGTADLTLTYPFAYNLDLDITDDCGNSIGKLTGASEAGAISAFISGTSPDEYVTASGADETKTFSAVLDAGAYTITKRLKIDADKLDEYAAHYMATNTCLLKFEDFLENTVDCPDTPGYGTIDITSCLVTEHMLLGDLSPMGQYGAIDGTDPTSVFTEINVLKQGMITLDNNWKFPVTFYADADGTESVIIHEGEEKTVAEAIADGLDLETFLSNWRSSWAKSLITYHPEYCYVAYADAICTVTGGPLSISSENYNNTLQLITTYSAAKTAADNPFGADLIGDPFTTTYALKLNDPYYTVDYTVIDAATGGTGAGHLLKQALLDQILKNYKNTGMSMWEFSMRTVICGADVDGACALPVSLTDPAFTSLTDMQKDQIWNTYKNLYLAEKRKVDQLFKDMHGMRNGCYNGYIGNETPAEPSIMAFEYYPEFIVTGITGSGSGYSGESILNLYLQAKNAGIILTGIGGLPYPWTAAEYTDLFADKQPRFMRIDDLYDTGIPEDEMLEEMAEEVDAMIYEETGKCALALDVEYFLSGMAASGYISAGTVTASELVPTFTVDLYTGMGGAILDPGVTGTPVNISVTSTEAGIEITANNADGSGTLSKKIVLNDPTAIAWTWNWADVQGFEMLYYEPGTETEGIYSFEILALVDVAGETKEVVITGNTRVVIGDCNHDPLCERPDNFAANITSLYYQLYQDSELGTISGPGVLLESKIGEWYQSTELQEQLLDYTSTAEILSTTSDNITLTSTDRKLTLTFSALAESLSIESITGSTYNSETGTVTIYYLDASDGLVKTFTATLSYEDISASLIDGTLELDCYCEEDSRTTLEEALVDLCNYVLNEPSGSPFYYLNPIDELTALIDYLDLTETDIYGDETETPGTYGIHDISQGSNNFTFAFEQHKGCLIDFSKAPGETGDLNDLVYISDISIVETNVYGEYQVFATGHLSDGSTVILEMEPGSCFEYPDCKDCVPQTVAPKSCNVTWAAYDADISAKNDAIGAGEDKFPEYTESEFCATNLAYAAEDYLYYLSEMGITTPDDDYYISISTFTMTDLQMGFYFYDPSEMITYDVESVIDDYSEYVTESGNEEVSWNTFVNQIWLVEAEVVFCPPAPQYLDLNFESEYPCEQFTANADTVNALNDYEIYLENTEALFRQRYIEQAIASAIENFEVEYPDKEYHYTLYYYDQAGNLIQTVPPAGIDRFENEINEEEIKAARLTDGDMQNDDVPGKVLPEHNYRTQYNYNTLNQLVWQNTPDGGESYFGYDALGRLVVSQNAKQRLAGESINEQFSYTLYDDLGRIIEVGEMTLAGDYGFDGNGHFITPAGMPVSVSAYDFPYGMTDFVSAEEVTKTQYDQLVGLPASDFEDYSADNTRNRITGVFYYENFVDGTDDFSTCDNATFYDYDVHGNVKELIQRIDDQHLVDLEQDKKKVNYEYDLISGNVKHVTYQKDEADQFIHQYEYDADNRITNVRTSRDNVIWEQDAKYFYYDHGPLARTEIGDKKVVASDYAYTIQGWLKGVNSEELLASTDMGKDGHTGMNSMVGRDVFGFSLHYFEADYTARHGNDFLSLSDGALAYDHTKDLYNGNIKEMFTASANTNEEYIGTSHTWYVYDQLNRIRSMDQEHIKSGTTENRYASTYTYDANGNLKHLTRDAWGDPDEDGIFAKTAIDSFTYHYNNTDPNPQLHNNQLTHVDDEISETVLGDDLSDQDVNNYTYTEIGELLSDKQEEIQTIEWKVTGKVHKIIRESISTKDNLEFVYDAMGNRIIKIITDNEGNLIAKTYYLRDAQGNVMSIYTLKPEELAVNPENYDLHLTERSIYGSSRVGTENVNQVIASTEPLNININTDLVQNVGDRSYELSNHLGNVLEVVTDRKVTELADQDVYLETFSSSGETEGWDAVNAPFDVVTELSGKLDIVTQFPWNGAKKMYTDLNPAQTYRFEANVENLNTSTTALAYVQYTDETGGWLTSDAITLPVGPYSLSLAVNLPSGITDARVWFTVNDASPDNMGHIEVDNARIVAEDLVCYVADVMSQSDYYPFGMLMPNRNESGSEYRYGFQGQEKDDEVRDLEGGSINYKYRMHDPRVGRFFAVDPLDHEYPMLTPYQFSSLNPIGMIEIEGLEGYEVKFIMQEAAINAPKIGITPQEYIDASKPTSEQFHMAMDAVGAIPVIGEVADGINGLVYVMEGDFTNAGISFVAIIPIIGEAGKVTKYVTKYGDEAAGLLKNGEKVDDVTDATKVLKESDLPPACFVPGTKIMTSEGRVDIEDVQIGDLVWSYNEVSNSRAFATRADRSLSICTIGGS